jgi:hypothetical protein
MSHRAMLLHCRCDVVAVSAAADDAEGGACTCRTPEGEKVKLPLAGKDLTISASEQDLEKAASPWQAVASQLAKNPKAEAKIGQSA